MKKVLMASTALAGASVAMAGIAAAAEAPTWKLTGNANFQMYWVDQDYSATRYTNNNWEDWSDAGAGASNIRQGFTWFVGWDARTSSEATHPQDHDWYFGVDEAELQLNVSGTADNGLNYGFKIEINALTTDTAVADEARLQLSGSWGTLQMGDEDGAEDIMNYGGENLMGATGGFDGDQDDYTYRNKKGNRAGQVNAFYNWHSNGAGSSLTFYINPGNGGESGTFTDMNLAAPGWATIAGDTADSTKVSYFSPRFSGFQVGGSITPTPSNGDNFKADDDWENHIGIGANYDNSFGDLRIRASAVYSMRTNTAQEYSLFLGRNVDLYEDVSAWSIGGIVGWGPFSLGANYTDNGDSGQPKVWDALNSTIITAPIETSHWNVAAGFETGPMYFSIGYFSSVAEINLPGIEDSTYDHLALTADYTVAPGLGVYAEIDMITDELVGGVFNDPNGDGPGAGDPGRLENNVTALVVGANISF